MGALADRLTKEPGRKCKFAEVVAKFDDVDRSIVAEWFEAWQNRPPDRHKRYHHSPARLSQLLLDIKIPVSEHTIDRHFRGRCCCGQTD